MQRTNIPTAATTPQPVRRETRSLPVTAETNEIACMREQIARQASWCAVQQKERDAYMKAMDKCAVELDEQEDQIEKLTREVNKKIQLLISGKDVYGLT